MNTIIYGPVPSWRLGRSLGIDLVSTQGKTCSFDCLYCQLGRTIHRASARHAFVSLGRLEAELASIEGVEIDFVTFSGIAEPTLAANLGQGIALIKTHLNYPVAVLTNASLMFMDEVRRDLSSADMVVAKLDAPDETLFRTINRPVPGITFAQTVEGIRQFRQEFTGTLALQMMFIEANKSRSDDMAELAAAIAPDEIQLNTPLRPCAVKPLDERQMGSIKPSFDRFGDRAVMVYEAAKPKVQPMDMTETLRRRPTA